MSYSNPILTAGVASNQSVWEVVTSPRHALGTRAQTSDGRSFYYSCNRGSAALGIGTLLSSSPVSVDMDALAVNSAAIGDTSVTITTVGTKVYAANELEGGFIITQTGTTGFGQANRITSHAATGAAAANVFNVDPIRVAYHADVTATIVPNPYSAVITAPAGTAHLVCGAATIAIGAGNSVPQYFWAQTWGICPVLADVASDVIGHSVASGTTAAGSFIGFVDAAGDVPQQVGVNLFTSADAAYMPVFLQIAP